MFVKEKLLSWKFNPSLLAFSLSRFGTLNRKLTQPTRWLPPPPDLLSVLIFRVSANGQSGVDDIMSWGTVSSQ